MSDLIAAVWNVWQGMDAAAQGGTAAAVSLASWRALGWAFLPRAEREQAVLPSRAFVALTGVLWAASWLLWPMAAAYRFVGARFTPAPPAPPAPVEPLGDDAAALVDEIATAPLAQVIFVGGSKRLSVGRISVDLGQGVIWHVWDGLACASDDYTPAELSAIRRVAVERAESIDASAKAARRAARVKPVPVWMEAKGDPKKPTSKCNCSTCVAVPCECGPTCKCSPCRCPAQVKK
jgi:hypothetical protein